MLPTQLPGLVFGFQKCWGERGRSTVPIQVKISCGRMTKIIMIFISINHHLKFIFNWFYKQHRIRKCLSLIEISSLRSCARFALGCNKFICTISMEGANSDPVVIFHIGVTSENAVHTVKNTPECKLRTL